MRRWSWIASAVPCAVALLGPFAASHAAAGVSPPERIPAEQVVVTATKLPTELESLPATVTVVRGEDARARGARDLRTALSLVAGVDIAPGGDAGPAGSVPGMWGLREFDAFLLVVDGVPYGGTFNPALATLSLEGVERIEVLRGAAPVMFGATSFVGVIYVARHEAGRTPTRIDLAGGSPGTAQASFSGNLPELGAVRQSVTLSAETREFSQDRSSYDRAHLLYRGAADIASGSLEFDLEATALRQEPYSPHPREGSGLTQRFPLDANVNPRDLQQDEDRLQANARFTRALGSANWTTTASIAHTDGQTTRGFLREGFATDGVTTNADGYRQRLESTEAYVDSYLAFDGGSQVSWIAGVDWMYGDGSQDSRNFEYAVLPDGSNAPNSHDLPIDEATGSTSRRSFGGLYVQGDWRPTDRWVVLAGLRMNLTSEDREGSVVDFSSPGATEESESDSASHSRLSGMVGVSRRLWGEAGEGVTAFANYRDTFKPAAVDFGPEGEGTILEPEEATSWEAGIKGRHLAGRVDWELAYFDMDFENLVIRENVDGLPALANAGSERFKGVEVEGDFRVTEELRLAATYAHHEARFVDYERLRPDGSVQQLGGNALEMSPDDLGSIGVVYSPGRGLEASVVWNYVGERYLNKGNTALADAYSLLDAGIGYRFGQWRVRVDGYNLTDARDPVAESELGDAQFYRMPGRSVLLSFTMNP